MKIDNLVFDSRHWEAESWVHHYAADTRSAFICPIRPSLVSGLQPTQAKDSLFWGSLEPELILQIFQGKVDATELCLENLAQFKRRRYLVELPRRPLLVPGWQPNTPRLLSTSHQILPRVASAPQHERELHHRSLLASEPPIRQRKVPRAAPAQRFRQSVCDNPKRRVSAAKFALGAAAAMLLLTPLMLPRNGETLTATVEPPWASRMPMASLLTQQNVAAKHPMRAFVTAANNPLAAYMTAPVPIAPILAEPTHEVSKVGQLTGTEPSGAVVLQAAVALPARPLPPRKPFALLQMPSTRSQHYDEVQSKRRIEARRNAASLHKIAAINIPMLPDILKPQ